MPIMDGNPEIGFYTTRIVEADTGADAAVIANKVR